MKWVGGGLDEAYAPLSIDGVSSVGLLAARACAAFPRWGAADAGQLRLYLVPRPAGCASPSAEAESLALAGDELFSAATLQSCGFEAGAARARATAGGGGGGGGGCRCVVRGTRSFRHHFLWRRLCAPSSRSVAHALA